jgi:hypothetical protein
MLLYSRNTSCALGDNTLNYENNQKIPISTKQILDENPKFSKSLFYILDKVDWNIHATVPLKNACHVLRR